LAADNTSAPWLEGIGILTALGAVILSIPCTLTAIRQIATATMKKRPEIDFAKE
jgi:hypothetical protein